MQGYRVFFIGSDGHITDRVEFFCPDDAAAKEHAKQLIDGCDIELWRLDQRIACFEAKKQQGRRPQPQTSPKNEMTPARGESWGHDGALCNWPWNRYADIAGSHGPSLDREPVVYTSVADKRIRNIWGK